MRSNLSGILFSAIGLILTLLDNVQKVFLMGRFILDCGAVLSDCGVGGGNLRNSGRVCEMAQFVFAAFCYFTKAGVRRAGL